MIFNSNLLFSLQLKFQISLFTPELRPDVVCGRIGYNRMNPPDGIFNMGKFGAVQPDF